jgi:hypothetical protein
VFSLRTFFSFASVLVFLVSFSLTAVSFGGLCGCVYCMVFVCRSPVRCTFTSLYDVL